MIGIPFIKELFTAILKESHAIEGRFYISTMGGQEINTDTMGELLDDEIKGVTGKKYPLALMMPPSVIGNDKNSGSSWESYRISIFFLTTTYRTSDRKISRQNPNTKTSTHTIVEDWHDMHRVAINFSRILHELGRKSVNHGTFRVPADLDRYINPVSKVGADSVSGVKIDFTISLFNGCNDREDYHEDVLSKIVLPVGDSHPEHTL